MPGRISGIVMRRNAVHDDAPRLRAASSRLRSNAVSETETSRIVYGHVIRMCASTSVAVVARDPDRRVELQQRDAEDDRRQAERRQEEALQQLRARRSDSERARAPASVPSDRGAGAATAATTRLVVSDATNSGRLGISRYQRSDSPDGGNAT